MPRALVVYESFFGNTEQVARAIATALQEQLEVTVRQADEVQAAELAGYDLLAIGSATRAFRPSPATARLLASIPMNGLSGVRAAAFDTRITLEDATSGFLRLMIRLFGWAAAKIAKKLASKGATLVAEPAGFAVLDSEGPLKEGELERAADWAQELLASCPASS